MAKLTTLLFAASPSAALAHPSVVAHDHPHAVSALAGLDLLFVGVIVAALAFAIVRQVRS